MNTVVQMAWAALLLFFSSLDENFAFAAFVVRINTQCQPVWAEPLQVSNNGQADNFILGVVPSSDNACIAIWQTGEFGAYSIRAVKVAVDGSILWEHEVIPPVLQSWSMEIVADRQNGATLVWKASLNDDDDDIYMQRITSDGALVWPDSGLEVRNEDGYQASPRVAVDDQGNTIVAWVEQGLQSVEDLRVQKISPTGEFLWGGGRLLQSVSEAT
ncbi:MAG: hypothetical protein IPP40_12050 [bacterium]|nr:hypothetical protein [bacterium]